MIELGYVWDPDGVDALVSAVLRDALGVDVALRLLAGFQRDRTSLLNTWSLEEARLGAKTAPTSTAGAPSARLARPQLAFAAHAAAYLTLLCEAAAANVRGRVTEIGS